MPVCQIIVYLYTIPFKGFGSVRFFLFYARQGCIYLIKNNKKNTNTEKYYYFLK